MEIKSISYSKIFKELHPLYLAHKEKLEDNKFEAMLVEFLESLYESDVDSIYWQEYITNVINENKKTFIKFVRDLTMIINDNDGEELVKKYIEFLSAKVTAQACDAKEMEAVGNAFRNVKYMKLAKVSKTKFITCGIKWLNYEYRSLAHACTKKYYDAGEETLKILEKHMLENPDKKVLSILNKVNPEEEDMRNVVIYLFDNINHVNTVKHEVQK